MKCPNCQKQNKPNVKKCEFCSALMPIRKKKSVTSSNASKKKVNEEIKKEPIIELEDEKAALKQFLNSIKSVNKIVWVYLLLIVLGIFLIALVGLKNSTTICKLKESDNNYSYSVNIKIKHYKNSISYFEYSSKYSSKNSTKKDYKETYEAMIEGLSSKDKFASIVSGSYGNNYWKMTYKFDENDFPYSEEYINMDISKYTDKHDEFVKQLEAARFECK